VWPENGRSLPSSLHQVKYKNLLDLLFRSLVLFCCLLSIVRFSAVSFACIATPALFWSVLCFLLSEFRSAVDVVLVSLLMIGLDYPQQLINVYICRASYRYLILRFLVQNASTFVIPENKNNWFVFA